MTRIWARTFSRTVQSMVMLFRTDFELEHLYGEGSNAWKNYYQPLQIAYIITQLITHGDLCRKLQAAGTGADMRSTAAFIEYYLIP